MTLATLALALLAGAALLAYDPAALADQPKRVALLVLGVLLISHRLVQRRAAGSGREVPGALLAFGGFVGVSALSLAWGAPAGALDLALWLAALGIALGLLDLPLQKRAAAVESMSAAGGAGAALYAVIQVASGARGAFVHGGQGNADWLGLLLAVTLLPTLSALAGAFARHGPARWPVAASLALQLFGLALARSRVAWFAVAIAVLVLAAARWRESAGTRRHRRTAGWLLALVPLSTLVALVAIPDAIPRLHEAWNGRLWIWRITVQVAVQSAPLGVGLGDFGQSFLDLQGAHLQSLEIAAASRVFVNAVRAHSDWLELWAESGPLAPILLALALFFAAREHFRARRAELGAALIALAVTMLADSPLRQPAIALILATVLATTSERPLAVPRAWLDPALLAGMSLLLAVSVSAWLGERLVSHAAQATLDERRQLLARAARLDPRSGVAALEHGLSLIDSGEPERALRELERSRALLPNVGTDVAIASAELALGRPGPARLALLRALARNPASFKARVNLAALELAENNLELAQSHLHLARSLYPGSPRLPPVFEALRRAELDSRKRVGFERRLAHE